MGIIEPPTNQPADKGRRSDKYALIRQLFRRSGIIVNYREIRSEDYVPGVSGWKLGADGTIDAVIINGLEITEDNIGFDDLTTGNVTNTHHGLVPKAIDDPAQYLQSDGDWDTIDYNDLDNLPTTLPPGPHATDHEDGGGDEIDVTGLTGLLADPQTPLGHHTSHEPGGTDPIVLSAITAVIPLAKITGGGTDGSITVTAGIITAYTAPT